MRFGGRQIAIVNAWLHRITGAIIGSLFRISNKEISMNRLLVIGCILLLSACSVEPGSEKWCAAKKEQPKSEWSGGDAKTFATSCLLESTTIGSEKWCEDLAEKPKGEWTADEIAGYAKHCVI
jgi:hypothetical protein